MPRTCLRKCGSAVVCEAGWHARSKGGPSPLGQRSSVTTSFASVLLFRGQSCCCCCPRCSRNRARLQPLGGTHRISSHPITNRRLTSDPPSRPGGSGSGGSDAASDGAPRDVQGSRSPDPQEATSRVHGYEVWHETLGLVGLQSSALGFNAVNPRLEATNNRYNAAAATSRVRGCMLPKTSS